MNANSIYNFIVGTFRWMPLSFISLMGSVILVRFAWTVMGMVDASWRLIGR